MGDSTVDSSVIAAITPEIIRFIFPLFFMLVVLSFFVCSIRRQSLLLIIL
jgi:hypothetical protein